MARREPPDLSARPALGVYRPPAAVRWVFALAGAGCAAASLLAVAMAVAQGRWEPLAGALVLAAPVAPAAAGIRRRVTVCESGLNSTGALGTLRVPWEAIRRVDVSRRSFVVESQAGPVSAGWLAASCREELLEAVVRGADLVPAWTRLPWGVRARYVRREAARARAER